MYGFVKIHISFLLAVTYFVGAFYGVAPLSLGLMVNPTLRTPLNSRS